MHASSRLVLIGIAILASTAYAEPPKVLQRVEAFKEDGRFGGWPANNGVWVWGNEIVVGFTLGYYKKNPTGGHDIDGDRPSTTRQARSTDGGVTWTTEVPTFADKDGEDPLTLTKPIDFSDPDLALRFRNATFAYSLDRARTWSGPFALPTYGRPGLLARTDYLVEGRDRVTAFVAAEKDGGGEGQPLCIRTEDGGISWDLVGWIGPQPPAGYGYAIMPSTVALPGDGYLSIIRRGGVFDGRKSWWIEPYVSPDDGQSWYLLDEPTIDNAGNPAAMIRLRDGRIAMTYGWRTAPYGMRARLSNDDGQTWSDEIILDQDSASWDIGYPRTVQRADGNCVTLYYNHPRGEEIRYIAGIIWSPGD